MRSFDHCTGSKIIAQKYQNIFQLITKQWRRTELRRTMTVCNISHSQQQTRSKAEELTERQIIRENSKKSLEISSQHKKIAKHSSNIDFSIGEVVCLCLQGTTAPDHFEETLRKRN